MSESNGLSREVANEVYDLLVEKVGANESWREDFIFHQIAGQVREWRFSGVLGFGGKFYRNNARRADGSYGERWYVSGYREDLNDELNALIELTTETLEVLRVERGI